MSASPQFRHTPTVSGRQNDSINSNTDRASCAGGVGENRAGEVGYAP